MFDSENAGATAGFSGYSDALSVQARSLGGAAAVGPEQSSVTSIPFPTAPIDPSTTFEFETFLNDTSQTGPNCRVRYVYRFAPPG